MNNKEAFELLSSQPSIRASSNEFIRSFEIPECEFHAFRRKFGQLKSDRDNFLKLKELATWDDLPSIRLSLDSQLLNDIVSTKQYLRLTYRQKTKTPISVNSQRIES